MFCDVACDVVLCVWRSLHNELEPDWWLAGRWGRHVLQRHGEGYQTMKMRVGAEVTDVMQQN